MITSLHTACDTVALSKGERKGQLYLRPALRPEWPPVLLKSLLNSLRPQYACISYQPCDGARCPKLRQFLMSWRKTKSRTPFPAGQKRRGRMAAIAGAYPLNSPFLIT